LRKRVVQWYIWIMPLYGVQMWKFRKLDQKYL